MDPQRINPQGQRIEPVHLPENQKDDREVRVAKTHLKADISSAASRRIEFPSGQAVEPSVQIIDDGHSFSNIHEKIAEVIEQQINVLETSIDPPPRPVAAIANEGMNKELQELIESHDQQALVETHIEVIIEGIQRPTDILHDAIEPYAHAEPFLNLGDDVTGPIERVINPIEISRTFLQGIELIGNGAELIEQAARVQETRHLLEKKEKQLQENPKDKQLQNYIVRLNNYLAIQLESLKEKIVKFSSTFATVSLKTTRFIIRTVEGVVMPFVNSPIGWALSFLDVISEAIALWRAEKAKTTHDVWMLQMAKDPRTFKQAEDLWIKRQERMISRKSEDQREDTILVMTRNAIQALAEAKVKNERKFFDFKLNKTKVSLTLACLSAIITVTLEALALTGVIAIAASTLAMPGLGFFILGSVLAGIGLYFFYKHKPNLFKCFVRGVNLRLAFLQIPAKIRTLQQMKKKDEIKKLEVRSARYKELEGLLHQKEALDHASFPKELYKILEKLHKETAKKVEGFESLGTPEQMKKILEQLEERKHKYLKKMEEVKKSEQELNQKLEKWIGKDGIVTKLQDQLKEAGNKDFALANHLVTTAENKSLNIPMVIVEKILDPKFDFDFDEETLKILKEKMGIDIKQQLLQGKMDKENLIYNLKEFFKMNDSQLLYFMKRRLRDQEGQAA